MEATRNNAMRSFPAQSKPEAFLIVQAEVLNKAGQTVKLFG